MPFSRITSAALVQGLLSWVLIAQLIAPCTAALPPACAMPPDAHDKTMTIDDLYACCGIPSDCSTPLPCASQRYRISGFVDTVNIWDQRLHPWLPEGKFILRNAARTLTLEVRVTAAAAPLLFDRLAAQDANWDGAVTLTGTLIGVDLPLMTGCHRAVTLLLPKPGDLSIGAGGDTAFQPR